MKDITPTYEPQEALSARTPTAGRNGVGFPETTDLRSASPGVNPARHNTHAARSAQAPTTRDSLRNLRTTAIARKVAAALLKEATARADFFIGSLKKSAGPAGIKLNLEFDDSNGFQFIEIRFSARPYSAILCSSISAVWTPLDQRNLRPGLLDVRVVSLSSAIWRNLSVEHYACHTSSALAANRGTRLRDKSTLSLVWHTKERYWLLDENYRLGAVLTPLRETFITACGFLETLRAN